MTKPTLTQAIIGSLSVLAIAVGATFVGIAFTAPTPAVIAEPTFETVPVLVPTGYGDEAPPIDLDGDPATIESSEVSGLTDVLVASGADVDPGLLATLDELATADDPASVTPTLGEAPRAPEDGAGGDPCAPREGESSADCPDGLHSTVLALTAPPEQWILGATRSDFCAPTDEALAVSLDVKTNAPGVITVNYWPQSNPTERQTQLLYTTDEQRATWEDGLARDLPLGGDWLRPRLCTVLRGLERNLVYQAELLLTDVLGREASYELSFTAPDDHSIPPTRIMPAGSGVVFVSAPHTSTEVALIRSWVVADGETPVCTGFHAEAGDLLPIVRQYTTDVSAAYLERHNYKPEYSQRTSTSFWVPEGSNIVVCIVWRPSDVPRFDWDLATRQSTTVVASPDRIVPTVTISGIEYGLGVGLQAHTLTLSARTRDGIGCGSWEGPSVSGKDFPPGDLDSAALCATGNRGSLERFTNGDVMVTSRVVQGDTATTQTSVLPIGRLVCEGVCELPEPSYFSIPLATVEQDWASCGSATADCIRGVRDVAAGTAQLRVDWAQGNTNGRSEWMVGASDEGPADRVRADVPQLDTDESVTATRSLLDPTYDLRFTLRADRPVTYTVTMNGDCFLDSTTRQRTGEMNHSTELVFVNACIGSQYSFTVELVAADGSRSIWGPDEVANLWPLGGVETPGEVISLSASYEISRDMPAQFTIIDPLTINIGGSRNISGVASVCVFGNSYSVDHVRTDDVVVGELVAIDVEVAYHRAVNARTGSSGAPEYCYGYDASGELGLATLHAVVHLNDLYGAGVTLTSGPESPYDISVTVVAVR